MIHARARKIVTLFRGGMSRREIARTLRMGRGTIGRVLGQLQQTRGEGFEQSPARPQTGRSTKLDGFEAAIADMLVHEPHITVGRALEELRRSGYTGGYTTLRKGVRALRPRREDESRQWMLRVLQCKEPSDKLRSLVASDDDLHMFVRTLRLGKLKEKNRVVAVLAVHRGISSRSVSRILHLSRNSVRSYCSIYSSYGCARLLKGFRDRRRKADDEHLQNCAVLCPAHAAHGARHQQDNMAHA